MIVSGVQSSLFDSVTFGAAPSCSCFVPTTALPLTLLGFVIAIAALYGTLVEATERRFFRTAQL
jgi:hypothetical protein